ncbi:MAG TPA: FAD-dependent monooxygenase [Vicinamibacterales bacterium]|nr:FAD-dependent monooxygenase [Vicinamibacterales bacterium]
MIGSATRVFDAVVVGGGPAGAATAIALGQRGLSAAIVERAAEPVARVGETLPPDVRRSLEALGVWDAFAADDHDPAIGNRSYWGTSDAGDLHFIATPYGSGWHIDRRRFEQMLLAMARSRGVVVLPGRQLHAVSGDRHGWRVRIPEALNARFLVDATGRASAVARLCGVHRLSIDQLVGATLFLERLDRSAGGRADPHGQFTMIEATPDGWWYSAPLPQRRLVVACMTDADLAARASLRGTDGWLSEACRTRATRDRMSAFVVRGTPRLASANTSRLASVVGPSWLAVGDAAVSFDPLSSQGIVTALECAIDAAAAIAGHLSGDSAALSQYALRITDRYRRYLVERAQYYGMERRWPGSPFWRRRQAHREFLHHAAAS